MTAKVKKIGNLSINVISEGSALLENKLINENDAEMDYRATRKPMILVFAGPNGSGKSTITQFFDKVGEYTNADDVVASTGMDNFEAAKMVDVYSSINSTSSSITSDMVL